MVPTIQNKRLAVFQAVHSLVIRWGSLYVPTAVGLASDLSLREEYHMAAACQA